MSQLLIGLIAAWVAHGPAAGQELRDAFHASRLGGWEARQAVHAAPEGTASGVAPAAWDESSWMLDPARPAAPTEEQSGPIRSLLNIARGRVLVEGGYAFLSNSSGGSTLTEQVVPDLMLRVGLTERLEVRVGWPGLSVVRHEGPSGGTSTTTLDPNVGLMWDLYGQDGWLPQTAVLASVPITLTGNRFTMNSIQPLTGLVYRWALTDRLSLGGESSVAFYRDQGDHFLQWQQSAGTDYLLTDRLGVFCQWQVLADDGSQSDLTRHLLTGGVSWLCTDRLQMTWRVGTGLNDPAPDFLTDIRFGFLF